MRFLSAIALVLSATQAASSAQSAPATQALTATTTYRNETLHVSYTYPASYKDASAVVGPAFQASLNQASDTGGRKVNDATRCVTLPFSAMDNSSGLAIVLLVRSDASCQKKTFTAAELPEFTRGEVQGLTASGARTQFGEPVAFTTEGHAAEWLRGSFQLPTGESLQAMVACVLTKPDVVCWQFLASSEANLRAMGAFPASLDGAAAAPVVPATLFAKP